MSLYLSQGLLLCGKRTCERNPAKNSTPRMRLRMALAAATHPLHGRTGSPCTSWPRKKGEHVRLDWNGEEPPSSKAHQSLGTGEPDQPPQSGYT